MGRDRPDAGAVVWGNTDRSRDVREQRRGEPGCGQLGEVVIAEKRQMIGSG